VTQPFRILVIDDEFSIVASLREVLEWEGYTVDTAPNGRLGLEAIARARPDVVLLDVMMPILDGPSMLRALRHESATRELPVIMMSAAPIRSPPGKDGHQAALMKPFDVPTLLAAINAVLSAKPR
jgi:DNA-binding response OmpR family regulator